MRWKGARTGVVFIVIGLLWLLQGLGYLPGSSMSGQRLWAILGAVLVFSGIALVATARRGKPPL